MSIPSGLGDALLNSASDAIVATDREGEITFWNPGAERIFGFTAGEAVAGRSIGSFPKIYARGTGAAFAIPWRQERAVMVTAICCRCPV
jgi:PAS domain-containing protein